MRGMGRLRGVLAGLVAGAFCLCLFAQEVEGQANPTPEQLQLFQGLTPEQQQSVRNALGGAGQAGSELGSGRAGGLGPDQQEQMRQEQRKSAEGEEDQEFKSPIPVLRREDWVIVEIDYQLPPRPIPPYLQALYAGSAQTGQGAAASLATQSTANAT